LPTSGVTAGTFKSVTVDTYGRVTAGTNPTIASTDLSDSANLVKVNTTSLAAQLPSLASDPASGLTAGQFWYSGGVLKYYDGTTSSVKSLSSGSGITDLTLGTGLTAAGGSSITTGGKTINVDVGTGNNQIVQLSSTGKLPAVDGSQLSGVVASGLSSTAAISTSGNITTTGAVSAGTLAGTTSLTTPLIYGSSASGGTLTLESTSHATKGNITIAAGGGNVGIGTTAPQSLLHVNGGVQLADDAASCGATKAGTMKYVGGNLSFCNGSAWKTLGISGAGLTSLGGQTGSTQTFAIGTSGTAPAFDSASDTHTLNIPMASTASVTAGLLSKSDYDIFNAKLGTSTTFVGDVSGTSGTTSVDKIKGTAVTITSLTSGDRLKYDGTKWVNSALSMSDISSGTLNVGNGGTGMSSVTANRLIASDGTGATLQAFTPCLTGQAISFDASGNTTCANVTGSSGFVNGGNTFAAAPTLGTADNYDLNFITNNTTKMTILAGGNVGIGTTSPSSALAVQSSTPSPSSGGVFQVIDGTNSKTILQASAVNPFSPVSGETSRNIFKLGDTGSWAIFGAGTDWNDANESLKRFDINATAIYLNGAIYPNGTVYFARTGAASSIATQTGSNPVAFQGSDYIAGVAVGRTQASISTIADNATAGLDRIAFKMASTTSSTLTELVSISNAGNLGIGTTAPTAALHLKAGGTAANSAPLKFTSASTILTAPEAGAFEYDGSNFYLTNSTPTRFTIPMLASGSMSGVSSMTGVTSIANSAGNIALTPISSGSVNITGAAATGSASGALQVSGGIGVSGSIYSGASSTISSGGTLSAATSTTSPIIYGSSLSSGSLTLDSTSDATKGKILLAPSGGNVGIGTTSPSSPLSVVGNASISGSLTLGATDGVIKVSTGNAVQISNGALGTFRLLPYNNDIYFENTNSSGGGMQFTGAGGGVYTGNTIFNTSGNVGIGTISPVSPLTVNKADSGTSGNLTAVTVSMSGTGATAPGGVFGESVNTYNQIATGPLPVLNSFNSGVFNNSTTSTVTDGFGYASYVGLASTGSMTRFAHLWARTPSITSAGILSTSYGIKIDAQKTTGVSSGFGVYQVGSTDLNYFAGNVGMGVTAPTAALHLKAGGTAANSAPLKFTSASTILTAPEAGAFEYDGSNFYLTNSTPTRFTIPMLASGSMSGVSSMTGVTSIANSAGNIALTPISSGSVNITGAAATGSASGALQVSGGIGVSGSIYSGASSTISSGGTLSAATSTTSPIIYGSSLSSGSLTLDSTSDATKGKILLAPSGGSVGIGTLTPSTSFPLDVVGNIRSYNANGSLTLASGTYPTLQGINSTGTATVQWITAPGAGSNYMDYTGTPGGGTGSFYIRNQMNGPSTVMMIDKDGKVGIGTTSPGSLLTVNGSGTVLSVTGNASFANAATVSGILTVSGATNMVGNLNVGATQNIATLGNAGGAAALNWANAYLGFNASRSAGTWTSVTDSAHNGGATLFSDVNGNIYLAGYATNATPAANQTLTDAQMLAYTRFYVQAGTGNVGIGTMNPGYLLDVNGTARATTYLYSSDARLKKDVETVSSPLDKVQALRGVYFTWKATGERAMGFIAQEVEKVLPDLVKTDSKSGYKSVQYANLVAVIVEAIKEMRGENLAQKAEIDQRLSALEKQNQIILEQNRILAEQNRQLLQRVQSLEKVERAPASLKASISYGSPSTQAH
jgi:hypothetical protein